MDEPVYPVYVGVWTNWSRGPVLGATLTLNRLDSTLLIAFVAFYVAWVGTRLWRIICMGLHYAYSSQEPQDAIHHQRQAILRNSSSPEGGLFSFLYLIWTWKKNSKRTYLRLAVVILASVVCGAGFVVASGFSSSISTAVGNKVLLSGAACGGIDNDALAEDFAARLSYFEPYRSKLWSGAADYARQCYDETPSGSRMLQCETFVRRRLDFKNIVTNASCPFDPAVCKSQDRNLLLDTDLLDSLDDFGINAPPAERFKFRQVMHCAPLATDGYTSRHNLSADRSYTRYHYGNQWDSYGGKNFTYEASNDAAAENIYTQTSDHKSDYTLSMFTALWEAGEMMYYSTLNSIIPELNTNGDADVNLVFMSANGIMFSQEVTDPWYNATTRFRNLGRKSYDNSSVVLNATTTYMASEPGSPLACRLQYQYCSASLPAGNQCGVLGSSADAFASLMDMVNEDIFINRMYWLYLNSFTDPFNMAYMLGSLRSSALLGRYGLTRSGIQGALPDDQWQQDAKHFASIALASLQSSFVFTALGPSDPQVSTYYRGPNATEESALCNSQLIQSNLYLSFSLFGLLFVFLFGGLIIALSFGLDPLMSQLRKRWGYRAYQQLEWRTNDALQLQRLAHEELGFATWSDCAERVPVTIMGEKLATLDISTQQHPKLQASVSNSDKSQKDGMLIQTSVVRSSTYGSSVAAIAPTMTGATAVSPASPLRSSSLGSLSRANTLDEDASDVESLASQRHGDSDTPPELPVESSDGHAGRP